MTYAVHNLFAPAVLVDNNGAMAYDGNRPIPLPEPLYTAETFEEAEEWRLQRQERIR